MVLSRNCRRWNRQWYGVSVLAWHATYHVALMPRVRRPFVCLCQSVCNVGGLWSHTAAKSGNGYTIRLICFLATSKRKPMRIVIFCDPEFYWGRPSGVFFKCRVLHVSRIRQFAYRIYRGWCYKHVIHGRINSSINVMIFVCLFSYVSPVLIYSYSEIFGK